MAGVDGNLSGDCTVVGGQRTVGMTKTLRFGSAAEPQIMEGPEANRQGFGGLSPSRGGGGEEEPPGGPEADRQGFGGLSPSHLRTRHLRRPGA